MPLDTHPDTPACPLCGTPGASEWHRDRRRAYHGCDTCGLVFVVAAQHLPAAAERAQYDLHENDLADPGYRRFLSRIATPVIAATAGRHGLRGIDVGCGPAPLLARMLAEAGIDMAVHDPFYAPDTAVLAHRYDVVTASEVVEHYRAPATDWARLFALVAPGGLLAVMTKRVRDRASFARWHYIQDPTHIAFHAERTFAWLATRHGARLEVVGEDVVVFRPAGDENAAMPEHARP